MPGARDNSNVEPERKTVANSEMVDSIEDTRQDREFLTKDRSKLGERRPMVQLLLGTVGRPGGGVPALRGRLEEPTAARVQLAQRRSSARACAMARARWLTACLATGETSASVRPKGG